MDDIARRVLDATTRAGLRLAEVRVERARSSLVQVRGAEVESIREDDGLGFGLSVWVDGCEGFASASDLSDASIAQAVTAARDAAQASALARRHPHMPALPLTVAGWRTPTHGLPWEVPLDERVALLVETNARAMREARVFLARSFVGWFRYERLYANTAGARIEQDLIETGAQVQALAQGGGEVEVRSYPTTLFTWRAAGEELIQALDLPGHAPETAAEAARLLDAAPCPEGRTTLVLGPYLMMLQIHESIGHPLELDRVLGDEKGFAGASFATPDRLGTRYGSDLMNVVVDPTMDGALGSYGFDDEGTAAARRPVIERGILVDYLSSRESATRLGKDSTASMRTVGWKHKPIVRMSNLTLLPGSSSFEEIVAGTEDGLYLEHTTSGSIDDNRLDFQFAAEVGRRIKGGVLTDELVRRPSYAGRTPEFWASMDALGDVASWRCGGTPSCGKGQPLQIAHVSHGSPVARFRNVRVGVDR
jgi:TldD protein